MRKFTSLLFQNPPPITLLAPVNGVDISVLRLDAIHPIVGGNKCFKLKYNLEVAKQLELKTIVTMGGAFSNHIAATALAGKEEGFKTIGIIRGEMPIPLNKTLKTAVVNGMELQFIDRTKFSYYREHFELVKDFFKGAYCIPEGGSNELAIKGCREILTNLPEDFDVVVCAVGTGTTLAGLTLSLKPHQQALGISVLKGADNLDEQVRQMISKENGNPNQFTIQHDYHFGGYAHQHSGLNRFVDDFNANQSFKIEPIYTGRMFFALMDLAAKEYFPSRTKILAIHTGGLQYLAN